MYLAVYVLFYILFVLYILPKIFFYNDYKMIIKCLIEQAKDFALLSYNFNNV